MNVVAAISILLGLLIFSGFLIFCVVNWARRVTGMALLTAAAVNLAWMASLVFLPPFALLFEALSTMAWVGLLIRALGFSGFRPGAINSGVGMLTLVATGATLAVILIWLTRLFVMPVDALWHSLALVVTNICGLVLIEQLVRNAMSDLQWRIRYLNIGLGIVFFYNMILHALTVAMSATPLELLAIQPAVLAATVPFICIASLRNRSNQLRINLSRELMFRTGVLAATGTLLISLSVLSYLAQLFAGDVGLTLSIFATVVASGLFLAAIGSRRIRNRLRVTLAKSFFAYRYDYRHEWIRLTALLTEDSADFDLPQQVQRALLHLLQSDHACMWILDQEQNLVPCANVSAPAWHVQLKPRTCQELLSFFEHRDWVLDRNDLPPSARSIGEALDNEPSFEGVRFLVPLLVNGEIFGVVMLGDSSALTNLSWEDYDIVKLISKQCAAFLALEQASLLLIQQEQFSAVNQMSAFLVHDIKTIAAQLSLLVQNADKHKENPVFIDDMLATVQNSVSRMNKIITGLRPGNDADRLSESQPSSAADADAIVGVAETLEHWMSVTHPGNTQLILQIDDRAGRVACEADELLTPVNHLVQNALDASTENENVSIRVASDDRWVYIKVTDKGTGMTPEFVATQLFKPFSTSKGVAGMGIGAYQARATARRLGGDIEVRSEPGKGSEFTLKLPIAID